LRLLSAGASGAILMGLGEGPLRTKELTERVPGYAPRTVYRYASKLTELGVVERHEEPGVPSKVVHSLTKPCGRELYELVEAYAHASLTRLPNAQIDAHDWGSLGLLADLWESGMIEALNVAPCSPTELAKVEHGLSYHQVNRRANLFAIGGLLEEMSIAGRRRAYVLTDKARRGMALIAGIGRWRRRHIVPEGLTGLTPREGGGVLRTTLPPVTVPEYAGKSFGIEIQAENVAGGNDDAVWASVKPDGVVFTHPEPQPEVDCRVRTGVAKLVDVILDGSPEGLPAEGERHLLDTCLSRLHAVLWAKPPALEPVAATAATDGSGL